MAMINLPSPPQGNADVIRRYLVQLIEQMNVELNTGFTMQATNAGAALSETQDALQQEIQGRWSATQKLIENTGGDVSALEQRVQALETLITNIGLTYDTSQDRVHISKPVEVNSSFLIDNAANGNAIKLGITELTEPILRDLMGLPPL